MEESIMDTRLDAGVVRGGNGGGGSGGGGGGGVPSTDGHAGAGDDGDSGGVDAVGGDATCDYSATAVFVKEIEGLVKEEDVQLLQEKQTMILSQLSAARQTLAQFNNASSSSYDATAKDLMARIRILQQLKSDLDVCFRRIRTLKGNLEEASKLSQSNTALTAAIAAAAATTSA
eukprot:TRINITY_DN2787_c0_g1_i1.p1 TRINITY_DN2787_c0_g1~~TRINITY_DN2787_c0_g1_i1.p1  ORF type:complete len:174 (-),score=68.26 TRINITY_DN2787_c0_g1_i1:446-967(-)